MPRHTLNNIAELNVAFGSGIPNAYRLVFNDDFDGAVLDGSKWWINTGSIAVRNSMLVFGPQGAGVVMQQAHGFRFGYIEFKAALAGLISGQNSYTSLLWTYPDTDNPRYEEIDITETSSAPVADDRSWVGINKMNMHVHCPTQPVSSGLMYNTGYDLSKGFHIYSCEWTPDYVKFFFDYNEVYTYIPGRALVPQGRIHVVMNLCRKWVGAGPTDCWPTTVPATFDAHMYVDYVRVYQKPS